MATFLNQYGDINTDRATFIEVTMSHPEALSCIKQGSSVMCTYNRETYIIHSIINTSNNGNSIRFYGAISVITAM